MIKEIKKELLKFLKALSFEADVLQPDKIKISERVIGGKVELIDENGQLTPIPDGEYKVDDFEFTVKDGVISDIKGEAKPDEEVNEEMEEEPKTDDNKAAIDDLKAETESIKKDVAELKEIVAQLAGKDEVEEFKKEVVELNKTLQVISKTPAQFSKTDNNPISKEKSDNTASILAGIISKK